MYAVCSSEIEEQECHELDVDMWKAATSLVVATTGLVLPLMPFFFVAKAALSSPRHQRESLQQVEASQIKEITPC